MTKLIKKYQQGSIIDDEIYYGGNIEPSIITTKFPDIKTKEGKRLASKLAIDLYNKKITEKQIPISYKNYIKGQIEGAIPTSQGMDKAGRTVAKGLTALASIPLLIETAGVTAPILSSAWQAIPLGIRNGLGIAGDVLGIAELASKNGIRKTIKLANKGDRYGALKSGAGDALNILGLVGTTKLAIDTGKKLASIKSAAIEKPLKTGAKQLIKYFKEIPLKTGAKQSIKYFKEIPINETAAYRVLKNDAINGNKAVKDAERLGLIRNFDKHRIPYYTYESIGDYTPNDNVIENLSRNFISVDPLENYSFKSLSPSKGDIVTHLVNDRRSVGNTIDAYVWSKSKDGWWKRKIKSDVYPDDEFLNIISYPHTEFRDPLANYVELSSSPHTVKIENYESRPVGEEILRKAFDNLFDNHLYIRNMPVYNKKEGVWNAIWKDRDKIRFSNTQANHPNSLGYIQRGHIAVLDNSLPTLQHELKHKVNNILYDEHQVENLYKHIFGDAIPASEYDTALHDIREKIIQKTKLTDNKLTNYDIVNKAIDNLSDNDLFKTIGDTGYGWRVVKDLKPEFMPNKLSMFRDALKFIGTTSIPLMLMKKENPDTK
jgi:hypothetical protein